MAGLIALFHPFYVGVTEVEYNAKEKTLEISVKVFAEDLEKTLKAASHTEVDLHVEKDSARNNKMVATYLQQHLTLKVNGKPVQLSFVGFEIEREASWCFLVVNDVNKVDKIEIINSLLYDEFQQQSNIMHVTVNGERKSTKLSFPDQKADFQF